MPEYMHKYIAGLVFVIAYIAIASDKADKTKVALLGASFLLILGVVSQHEAFGAYEYAGDITTHAIHQAASQAPTLEVRDAAEELLAPSIIPDLSVPGADWNTIFLLIGMMIVVGITRQTGVFQWLAVKAAKMAKGDPLKILVLLSVITAIISAGLDNVTTVMLIAPVTLAIAASLRISPFPLLLCEVMASNIGGTATLIGDPPNIIIGSKANLGFMDFLQNLAPVIAIVLVVYVLTVRFIFRKSMSVSDEVRQEVMRMDESKAITDKRLLGRCLFVIGLILVGFGIHSQLGWEPATVALSGAALLFLISGIDAERVFGEIEWPTIFFFLGLFIMVGSLVKVGIIADISTAIAHSLKGNIPALVSVMLWFSAFASAIVDNIPYAMAMSEVVIDMAKGMYPGMETAQAIHQPAIMATWWALALGACLGGNGTLVGASANVVVAGIAKRSGHPISFVQFLKYGAPLMVQSVLVCWLYIWLRYLRAL